MNTGPRKKLPPFSPLPLSTGQRITRQSRTGMSFDRRPPEKPAMCSQKIEMFDVSSCTRSIVWVPTPWQILFKILRSSLVSFLEILLIISFFHSLGTVSLFVDFKTNIRFAGNARILDPLDQIRFRAGILEISKAALYGQQPFHSKETELHQMLYDRKSW